METDAQEAGPPTTSARPALPSSAQVDVLLSVLPCGVLIEDARGRCTFVNAVLRRQFDLHDDEPDVQARIRSASADPHGFADRAAHLTGTSTPVTEDVNMADGRVFERDYLPVVEHGEHVGQVWTYWDFTERKREERARERGLHAEILAQRLGVVAHRARADEAEQSGRELAETDALRQRLMATASHELRTPLTSIMSFAELLADDTDGEAAQFVAAIRRNARRLLALVDDLLLLARLSSGVEQLDSEAVDFGAVAREAVADLATATVSVEIDAPAPVVVRADHAAVSQIVTNLVGNAVKYSNDGGRVHIRIDGVGDEGRMIVRDEGIGIPAQDLDRVFEQFFRSPTARTSGRAGSGLGLPIVRGLVDSLGGRIVLESTPGAGTSVDVRLPRS